MNNDYLVLKKLFKCEDFLGKLELLENTVFANLREKTQDKFNMVHGHTECLRLFYLLIIGDPVRLAPRARNKQIIEQKKNSNLVLRQEMLKR